MVISCWERVLIYKDGQRVCVSVSVFCRCSGLDSAKSIWSIRLGDSAESGKPAASEPSVHVCVTDSSAEKVSCLSFRYFCTRWKLKKTPTNPKLVLAKMLQSHQGYLHAGVVP